MRRNVGMMGTGLLLPLLLAGWSGAAMVAPVRAAAPPPATGTAHVEWAEKLLRGVSPETNEYDSHPTVVTWAGVGGSSETRNRSVCSSLVARLMMQAYGYDRADFKRWMGTTFPQAQDFHDAIVAEKGFQRITRIARIAPGDILAVKYPPGSHPTGHVMLVVEAPQPRRATPPELAGTQQYEVLIIDSSRSGHGPADSRHYAKGKYHSGVGEGMLRLYAGADGAIAGYSWSTTKASTIFGQDRRDLVVGRLTGAEKPTGSHSGKAAAATPADADEPAGDVEPPSPAEPPGH
jgi:hypothetical protein